MEWEVSTPKTHCPDWEKFERDHRSVGPRGAFGEAKDLHWATIQAGTRKGFGVLGGGDRATWVVALDSLHSTWASALRFSPATFWEMGQTGRRVYFTDKEAEARKEKLRPRVDTEAGSDKVNPRSQG